MPQSLVKILVHIVFSTKNRVDLIVPEIETGLYGYIHGIIENNKAKLITANGTANHSHFLVSLGRNDVSELIGDIKRDSSGWAKKNGMSNFYMAARLRRVLHWSIAGAASFTLYSESERTS